ncbi:hypothetical protein NDU88_001300 [Pleurodeles waltl]|uniref:Reverse transcriptase/retrotransposon-derived protein RNase H-like domain-containing protein n=1 Tax=Pleurodeles waltl TaxID=8319 RepID=A0AAV7WM91_PLEWA|nr:hypothetical protein NDU88_001300 [Pleurodeles waltl]
MPGYRSEMCELRYLRPDCESVKKKEQKQQEECQKDSVNLNEDNCESPPLQGFDLSKKSVVTTDATGKGLIAVLTQLDDRGNEVLITFSSRSLMSIGEK